MISGAAFSRTQSQRAHEASPGGNFLRGNFSRQNTKPESAEAALMIAQHTLALIRPSLT